VKKMANGESNEHGLILAFYDVYSNEEISKTRILSIRDIVERKEEYIEFRRKIEKYGEIYNSSFIEVKNRLEEAFSSYNPEIIFSDYYIILRFSAKINDKSFSNEIKILYNSITDEKKGGLFDFMEFFSYLVFFESYFKSDLIEVETHRILEYIMKAFFIKIILIINDVLVSTLSELKPTFFEPDNPTTILNKIPIALVENKSEDEKGYLAVLYDEKILEIRGNENRNLIKTRLKIYRPTKMFSKIIEQPVRRIITEQLETLYGFLVLLNYLDSFKTVYHPTMIEKMFKRLVILRQRYFKEISRLYEPEERLNKLLKLHIELSLAIIDFEDVINSLKMFIQSTFKPKLMNIYDILRNEIKDVFIKDEVDNMEYAWLHITEEAELIFNEFHQFSRNINSEIETIREEYSRSLLKAEVVLMLIAVNIPTGVGLMINGLGLVSKGDTILGFLSIFIGLVIIIFSLYEWRIKTWLKSH